MQENGFEAECGRVIADASKAMFSREGLTLGRFREELAEKGKTALWIRFVTRLSA